MPRRMRIHRRRAASRSPSHRRGNSWKSLLGKGIAAGIAFGPVAVTGYEMYKGNNDHGYTAASHVIACYTGYDIKSNQFPRFDKLAIGYGPIVGALIFKKVWSKVMR